jgi:hypothetical protein
MYVKLSSHSGVSHQSFSLLDQVVLGTVIGAVLGFYLTFAPTSIIEFCLKVWRFRTS